MKIVLKKFITLITFLSIGSFANAQSEDVTLIFKRPFLGLGDYYTARINVGDKEVCALDSNSEKIVSCLTKVNSGEISIKVSSLRGSEFKYVIDVLKGKTYTLVIYERNNQYMDIMWSNIGLVKNKVKESDDYKRGIYSFKIQVISVE
jgi:hypothetical protein